MFKKIKIFTLLIISTFVFYSFFPVTYADTIDEDTEENNQIYDEAVETSAIQEDSPNINSRAAVVIDRSTNNILFGKNENSQRKMASTTKIMTCLVVLENSNLTDTATISKKSAQTGGSRLGLKTDDKVTINDLLYGLMLCSGNDAAVALAEHVGGSVENFSVLMNNKAKELGLENTNFETPHGLDSDNHYTTAYELALLANHALNNPTFAKIVGTKSYTVNINGSPKTLTNTNELLGNLNGVYGIKTGFTNGANRCLVTACKRDNLDIICVVLGADTKKFRTSDSIKLIEYAFKTYEPVNIEQLINDKFEKWKNENLKTFNIIKGNNQEISIKFEPLKNGTIPIKKDSKNNLKIFITCSKTLEPPLSKGSQIGLIEVYSDSCSITSTPILLDCNIEKKNISNYFLVLLKTWKTL